MSQTKRRPRSLSQLLGDNRTPQANLYRRAGGLLRWQRLLEREMSSEFIGHWRLARLDEQALVLYADSSAWATRLRYVGTLMRRTVAANGGPKRPRVIVKVTTPAAPETPPPKRKLSGKAGDVLAAAARATPDRRLAASLRRLSRRAEKGSGRGPSD